jgi:hypothetical protein
MEDLFKRGAKVLDDYFMEYLGTCWSFGVRMLPTGEWETLDGVKFTPLELQDISHISNQLRNVYNKMIKTIEQYNQIKFTTVQEIELELNKSKTKSIWVKVEPQEFLYDLTDIITPQDILTIYQSGITSAYLPWYVAFIKFLNSSIEYYKHLQQNYEDFLQEILLMPRRKNVEEIFYNTNKKVQDSYERWLRAKEEVKRLTIKYKRMLNGSESLAK